VVGTLTVEQGDSIVKHILRHVTLALLFGGYVAGATPGWAQDKVTVPAGTRLLIRMTASVDTSRSRVGTIFTGELETNLTVGRDVVAPAGTVVHGRLANVTGAGRAVGRSDLQLELTDIVINGTAFPIVSSDYSVQGGRAATETVGRTLRGVGLGAAMGAFNSSAGRGAGMGATAAAAASVMGRGEQVGIPRGTILEFRLQEPASLPRR
jgi:hypothetical protein